MSDCRAVASVDGVAWPCDLEAPHPTIAHRNKERGLVWCSHYEAIRNTPPKQVITPREAGIQ